MAFSRRLGAVIGVLVAAIGYYRLPRELAELAADVSSFVFEDAVSAAMFGMGLLILAWAFWDAIRAFIGLGRSSSEWVRVIRHWTHEKRDWELVRSGSDKSGFHIVFRVGPKGLREVAIERPEGSEMVIMAMDIQVDEADRARLTQLSDDAKLDLRDDVRMALSALPVDFDIAQEGQLVTNVHIATAFRADALLTEAEFMSMLRLVLAAFMSAVTTIGRTARKAAHGPAANAP